jgi:hypothetical protein
MEAVGRLAKLTAKITKRAKNYRSAGNFFAIFVFVAVTLIILLAA